MTNGNIKDSDNSSHLALDDRIVLNDGDVVDAMTVTGLDGLQVNNAGDILFFAFIGASRITDVDFSRTPSHGVFLNNELVVASGQLVDGKTDQWVMNASVNESGQVGVGVIYDDRSTELFLGTPSASVPEPSSSAIAIVFLLGGLIFHRHVLANQSAACWRRRLGLP
jgi:hypothetical protein